MTKAVEFLAAQIGQDGMCKGEYPQKNPRFGGKTALCLYALLTALEDHRHPAVQRGLNWLSHAKLYGTYAVAMRACAYAAFRDRRIQPLLANDVRWLLKAAGRNGAYTYTSLDGGAGRDYDNSNSQMAVLAIWAGANRGVEVPAQYWQLVERYWQSQQQNDGGWPYRDRPDLPQTRTYGSMTAAGLATLYICFDNLRRDQFVRCTAATEYEPIRRGLEWLAKNFRIEQNPRKGANWYFYWLYCLERVALASGRKYFGGHDWYTEGAGELLAMQKADGSWGYGELSVAQTALAVLFLARGRSPVLLNKLRYEGQWNARPRDAANLARFVTYDFERPVTWQVVGADTPLADWHEAPLMYISGAGPCRMTDQQVAKLRTFVFQGATIISEAACNSATFTLDMEKVYRRMFPAYPLRRLPDDHPIYSLHFRPKGMTGLSGVSNGVRLLAIHAPREISLALQLGPRLGQRPWFELAANMYLYATDRGRLRPRGASPWPRAQEFQPLATVRLIRLKHEGNCDPEPLAWQRMRILAGNRYRIRLEPAGPAPMTELDIAKCRVAVMTGTAAFKLSPAEAEALRKFLQAGGTLLCDAAGGSRAFAEAVEKQIFPLFPGKFVRRLASEIALTGPARLQRVSYRSEFASALGPERDVPRLWGLLLAGRPAVILSRADLTAGLAGCGSYKLRGYTPNSAVGVMINLLCRAAGVTASPRPPPERT